MSETPRTDAEVADIPRMIMHNERYTEPVSSLFAATLERELAAMTARAEHIESGLAAVTAERDALRRDHNGCALWAEGSRRERDRLKAELANATAAKDLAEREMHNRNNSYLEQEHDLAIERDAIKAAK